MPKPPKSENLFIEGPAGRLESILEYPGDDAPLGAVVVCHPHPLYGGTMQNKVAHTLARAFIHAGFAALRFNFRGVGQSDGEYDESIGELDDALAVMDWCRNRFPLMPFWIAGFSFGAAVAVKAATAKSLDGLVSVAPAISRFASGLESQPECPWLIVQGDEDELVAIDETLEWVNGLLPGPELIVVEGGEHFFHGRLVELRSAVTEFVNKSAV